MDQNNAYTAPRWPGISFDPAVFSLGPTTAQEHLLWYRSDQIIYFVLWSTIIFTAIFATAGLVSWRSTQHSGVILCAVFVSVGLVSGALVGLVTGALISSIYYTGNFGMSTWIPLAWSIFNALSWVLISYTHVTFAIL